MRCDHLAAGRADRRGANDRNSQGTLLAGAVPHLNKLTRHPLGYAVATAAAGEPLLEIFTREARSVAMKLRKLPQGSPQAKRRDELLAIMRDETRPDEERDQAAKAAAPWRAQRLGWR